MVCPQRRGPAGAREREGILRLPDARRRLGARRARDQAGPARGRCKVDRCRMGLQGHRQRRSGPCSRRACRVHRPCDLVNAAYLWQVPRGAALASSARQQRQGHDDDGGGGDGVLLC